MEGGTCAWEVRSKGTLVSASWKVRIKESLCIHMLVMLLLWPVFSVTVCGMRSPISHQTDSSCHSKYIRHHVLVVGIHGHDKDDQTLLAGEHPGQPVLNREEKVSNQRQLHETLLASWSARTEQGGERVKSTSITRDLASIGQPILNREEKGSNQPCSWRALLCGYLLSIIMLRFPEREYLITIYIVF